MGSPATDQPMSQNVKRGGGAKPGSKGVPASNSGRADATSPPSRRAGQPQHALRSGDDGGQSSAGRELAENGRRHLAHGALDQDRVERPARGVAAFERRDDLADAGERQLLAVRSAAAARAASLSRATTDFTSFDSKAAP